MTTLNIEQQRYSRLVQCGKSKRLSTMKSLHAFFAAVSLATLNFVPASAQEQSRSDQGEARREMKAGNQLSLREIERRILPRMQDSEYLGPAYDSTARAYRLKFIKNGRVTYIDVDARTGRIISRSR